MRTSATPFARLVALGVLGLASHALAAVGSGGSGLSGGGGSAVDPEVAGEVLVKLRSTDALQPLMAKYALSLVSRFGARPIYRLKVTGTLRAKDAVAALALEPAVMIAETNTTHRSPEARKNLPWAIGTPEAYRAQWAPDALRLAEAQRVGQGEGVRVAVLDTGIDASHPLLAGRLLPGRDFVDGDDDPAEVGSPANAGFGHGTHVAGLVAMTAPRARIVPLRVLDADGVGNAWVLAEAMLYAVDPDGNPATDDGAHVINLSLGSLARTRIVDAIAQIVSCAAPIADDAVADRSDPGYGDDLVRCATGNGAVVVAASGNDASSSAKEYPAAEGYASLLAVAASTSQRRLAGFSNFGPWIDLAAPGEGITSAIPGGLYGTWSGTSMAAPLAAGVAALVRSLDLAMTPRDVVQRLKRASATLCGTNLRQLDAAAAVTNLVPTAAACR